MRYSSVQILEVIDGRLTPIDHEWNKDEREAILVENIPSDKLARVKHSLGMTLDIGGYQSARVDVGIELPAHVDAVDNASNDAAEYCNGKLMEEVDRLLELKKVFGRKS